MEKCRLREELFLFEMLGVIHSINDSIMIVLFPEKLFKLFPRNKMKINYLLQKCNALTEWKWHTMGIVAKTVFFPLVYQSQ